MWSSRINTSQQQEQHSITMFIPFCTPSWDPFTSVSYSIWWLRAEGCVIISKRRWVGDSNAFILHFYGAKNSAAVFCYEGLKALLWKWKYTSPSSPEDNPQLHCLCLLWLHEWLRISSLYVNVHIPSSALCLPLIFHPALSLALWEGWPRQNRPEAKS